ncbi:MAG TPA: endonuclease/exonuclease/phosphatase family protein [Pyrinomonadaceae bacterium]|nr:endonuclease/exonuclease/phosphatase family protein [Pyrinomonadaceae bacterium]
MTKKNPTQSLLLIAATLLFSSQVIRAQNLQPPPFFSYNELVALYEQDPLPDELRLKLERLTTTPIVNNAAHVQPMKPNVANLGRVLRVASWNIERGLNFTAVRAALLGADRYARFVDPKRKNRLEILQQASVLRQADVIVLNEVDWGLKRTDYRDVARELAAALGMNYAYGVEFVEVDPLVLGTETFEGVKDDTERAALVKETAIDQTRTRNLHGNAILSRYPLSNVRLIPFKNQGYDWYAAEKKKISKLEEAKRKGAAFVFDETIAREVRRGGRMMMLADIEDADLPGGRVTIVATHLEDKVKPEGRVKQLEEVLAQIKEITNPVIVAGDMNTNGTDATPTSFKRAIKHRLGSGSFWVNRGIKYATGVGLLYDVSLGAIKTLRTWNDPTVKSVKFVSENPEEKFFERLKEFRFTDGGAFDFRGAKAFSTGGSEDTLSDSNERASKGFVATFSLEGKIDLEFKLDWFFVKPIGLTDPDDRNQPFNFAPAFGRTLKALNESIKDRISDHNPITVELPLGKPKTDSSISN